MQDESVVVGNQSINPGKNTTKAKKSKPICRFYAKSGSCKFDEKCRFLHEAKSSADCCTTSSKDITDQVAQLSVHGDHEQASVSKIDSNAKRKRCRFFNTKAGCSRGDACKFAHQQNKQKTDQDRIETKDNNIVTDSNSLSEGHANTTNADTISNNDTIDSKTVGLTAINSSDSKTEACVEKENESVNSVATKTMENTGSNGQLLSVKENRNTKRVITTTQLMSSLDKEQLAKLRTREIEQLLRRFGKDKSTEMPCSHGDMYSVIFNPSDPDWPFDIDSIVLEVLFSPEYPKKMFNVWLSEKQSLPAQLISLVNEGIVKWVQQQQTMRDKKDTVDLPFRPFLRWLDRNIEKLFIDAAKVMQAQEEQEEEVILSDSSEEFCQEEYVMEAYAVDIDQDNKQDIDSKPQKNAQHHRRIDEQYSSLDNSDRKDILLSDFVTFKGNTPKNKGASDPKSSHLGDSIGMSTKDHIVFVDGDTFDQINTQKSENACSNVMNLESIENISWADTMNNADLEQTNEDFGQAKPKGTEIRFRGLELFENTSTLRMEIVVLTMECTKCKNRTDIKADIARPTAERCEKCSGVIRVGFRPSMIHQYSTPTLGYLDLDGCHPFDLVMAESSLIVGCLGCSHETTIKGPQYGSNQVWCTKCHQKLQFKIESTRFFKLMPSNSAADVGNVPMPKKKVPKTPGLREGFPLPNNGACKHYKKSFRWLRFPCCGKCYPCDVCHEEEESHEMKYATRMVCGFCSKEQPFSQGACIACKSSTTKAKTSHWEGGKGCRNKTLMNRGDDKKYKNTMKTTSRKSQAKPTPGKSKSK